MAIIDDVSLNGDSYSNGTDGSVVYGFYHRSANSAIRQVEGSTTSGVKSLTISHQDLTRKGEPYMRSVARIDEVDIDSENTPRNTALYVVCDRAIHPDITNLLVDTQAGRLIGLMRASWFWTKFLDKQT